jgi:hypothetical protein
MAHFDPPAGFKDLAGVMDTAITGLCCPQIV